MSEKKKKKWKENSKYLSAEKCKIITFWNGFMFTCLNKELRLTVKRYVFWLSMVYDRKYTS